MCNEMLTKNYQDTVDSRYNKLLGPSEITLYQKCCYIPVAKTRKHTEILIFWAKQITLLYQDFVIHVSVFFIMRVHCTNIWYNVYEFRKESHCKATTICKTLTSYCLCTIYHILHGCCQQTKMYIHRVDIPDFMHDFKL